MQTNPENYQSRPPLPEVVPEAHTDSSVHLTTFVLLFFCNLLNTGLIDVALCAGPSGSRTVSNARDGAAGELAVESPLT